MRIRVGFVIADKIYVERLVSSLNRSFSDKLEIYSYTDVKVANESIERQRLDLVIVDESLQVNEYRNCGMAYFVNSSDIDKLEGKKAICKFQKVELIYKDILELYSEYSSRVTKRKRSGELAEVITFTSPASGSGVTSIAAAFAINCSLNNKSALYLNMENIPSTDIVFEGEGKYTLTDVVYAVKSRRTNLSLKLESYAITDPVNVDYFSMPKNPMDIHEMNEEDVELLISELKAMGLYDFIVVDAGFNINNAFKRLIECSDKTVLVVNDDERSAHKIDKMNDLMKVFVKEDDFIRKAYFVVNDKENLGAKFDWTTCNVITRTGKATGGSFRKVVEELANNQDFLKLY
jgi:MinD-like ATPase involved in chromosome partitioning or flagellar assembly